MNKEKLLQYYTMYKEKFSLNQRIIYTIFFYLSLVFMISMVVYWYTTTRNLNNQSSSLELLSSYNVDVLTNNENIKEVAPFWKNINDIFDFHTQLTDTIAINQKHRKELSLPFDNFLYLLYTPSLNVWRDPFTQKIDTTLIGKKYLENNPYGDIALMEQWTNFFKDVWIADSYNTISNINIGNIESVNKEWYFGLTVTVDFESPDKRSFLLLVNKLSMTAYLENVSLINEFVFYLWENIKKDRKEFLTSTQQEFVKTIPYVAQNQDKLIWYLLFDWAFNDKDNFLLSNETIIKTIRQTAWCIDEDQKKCNYLFRQKMRTVPYLAYGIGRDDTDTIAGLKTFFNNIPPLLSIESFSFDELKKIKLSANTWYKWSVSIKVYGRDIMNDEINTISNELWIMCFATKESMTATSAKTRVEKYINDMWKQNFDTRRSTMLNQVLGFVTTIQDSYDWLPNYKKVVKLFELYRTLKENWLCDIIDPKQIESLSEAPELTGNVDVFEEIIEPALSGNNVPLEQLPPSPVEVPAVITWSTENRTIGDGYSARDKQLINEIEQLQQWASL